VKIPMLASGGFGDGRGLVAALALGADGINMGTRFCVTKEAPIPDAFKQKMVANDERATDLIFRTLHNTARVMKNEVSQAVVAIERKGGAKFEDVQALVAGTRGRDALANGDVDGGIWSAGMIQGLIHDIPSVKELVDRIISEAETIIRGRLDGVLAA
jgi:NAD(P)H-dependent flavin oxidoreductase YrpB (nitropropane dioxygenase family)